MYHRLWQLKKADGTVSYTAQIRIKKHGAIVYQENHTFARKQAAVACAKRREAELYQPGAVERANRKGTTVKEMIDRYLVEMEKVQRGYVFGHSRRGRANS